MADSNPPVQMSDPTPTFTHDTWSRAWSIGLCCFFGGFILAILFLSEPEFRLTGFVMIIAFSAVVRWVRGSYMQHELSMAQAMQAIQKNKIQLLKEQSASQQRDLKIIQEANKTQHQSSKPQSNYVFTSDDFDDAAQGLLLGPVKAARKANAKVTGQGLVETFLKGLR